MGNSKYFLKNIISKINNFSINLDSKKINFVLIISVSIFIIILYIFSHINFKTNTKIKVKLKIDRDEVFQLFYDDGNKDTPFNIDDSIFCYVKKSNRYQVISFKIPHNRSIKKIRLDFGDFKGNIKIKYIQIEGIIYKYKWNSSEIKSIFIPNEYISNFYIKNNVLNVESLGYDPFIVLNKNIRKKYNKIKNSTYTFIIVCWTLLITLLFLFTLYYTSFFYKRLFKNNYINGILSLLFLIVIYFPILNIIIPIYKNPNRIDKYSLNSKLIFDYPKFYEKYYNDNFILKNEIKTISNFIKLKIIKSSPDSNIIIGKNGYLFYSQNNNKKENDEQISFRINKMKKQILKLQKYSNTLNYNFFIVIIPDKKSVYYDFLPDYLKSENKIMEITKKLKEVNFFAELNIINLTDNLIKSKNSFPVYYKTGSFYNNYGRFTAYKNLILELNKNNYDLNIPKVNNIIIEKNDGYGDIAKKINLSGLLNDEEVLFDLDESFTGKKYDKNILLFGSYYINILKPFFDLQFNNVEFMNINDYSIEKQSLINKFPDAVFYEIHENDFKIMFENL